MNTAYSTRLLSDIDQLDSCLANWREWAKTPLQTPEWLLSWWQAYRTPASKLAVILVLNADRRPVGLAPLFQRNSWSLGSTLRFLGSGKACTDFQSLLAAPSQENAVVESVAQHLMREQGASWSLVELEGVSPVQTSVAKLASILQSSGWRLHRRQFESTWLLDLRDGWKGFLSRLSYGQRRQSRNLFNRFQKNSNFRLHWLSSGEDVIDSLSTLIALHQRRWNASGSPGCFADGRFRDFLCGGCLSLAERGQITMAVLEDGTRPIAVQLYLSDQQKHLFMYQSGRDPERDSESIGRMLNLVAIERACSEGYTTIDFLRGDEIYKSRLGAVPTPCEALRLVAPRTVPQVRQALWRLARSIRAGHKSSVHPRTQASNLSFSAYL